MAFGAGTSLSNQSVLSLPTLPTLPGVGNWMTDPTFGTRLMQLGDKSNATDWQVVYSYWPSMNSDNTRYWLPRFAIGSYGVSTPTLYDFDPVAETMAEVGNLYTTFAFLNEAALWSWTEPNVMYGAVSGSKILRKMEITGPTTRTYSIVGDLTGRITNSIWQLHSSRNNRFFVFSDGSQLAGTVVYDSQTDTVYTRDNTGVSGGLDETHIDGTGAYAIISGALRGYRWDFVAGSTINDFGEDVIHHDTHNLLVCSNTELTNPNIGPARWPLTLPLTGNPMFDGGWYSGIDKHVSWLSTSEDFVFISTFKNATPWTKYQNELLKVWGDGSGQWRRLCHHRSYYPTSTNFYRSTTKANISRDGRWLIFATSWDNDQDAGHTFHYPMMLKVPTEAEFAAGDYGSGGYTLGRPPVTSRPAVSERPMVISRPGV